MAISKISSTPRNCKPLPRPPPPPLPPVKTIFLWDFDWTIVNCNSDEYIPSQFLGDEATIHHFRRGMQTLGAEKWHECVASLINICVHGDNNEGCDIWIQDVDGVGGRDGSGGGGGGGSRGVGGYLLGDGIENVKKCSKEDLYEAAASMPYLTEVREALRDVANVVSGSPGSCGQAILSDGNDKFIGAFLDRNGMRDYFSHGIETNIGIWAGNCNSDKRNDANGCDKKVLKETFRIEYQSTKLGGHSCPKCPPNLCKSQALLDILKRINASSELSPTTTSNAPEKDSSTRPQGNQGPTDKHTTDDDDKYFNQRPRIIYIGDGSNDACPALNVLSQNDILLARGGRKRRDPNSKSGPESDSESPEGRGIHNFHPEMHKNEVLAHSWNNGSGAPLAFPILGALRKAYVNEGRVAKCRVSVWRTGKELRGLIHKILEEV